MKLVLLLSCIVLVILSTQFVCVSPHSFPKKVLRFNTNAVYGVVADKCCWEEMLAYQYLLIKIEHLKLFTVLV